MTKLLDHQIKKDIAYIKSKHKPKRKLNKEFIVYLLLFIFISYQLYYAYQCHVNKDIEADRVNMILDELGY
jgi:hypothetical protein